MATDRTEAKRRGQDSGKNHNQASSAAKAEARQFVQIKTVVKNSAAYRACTPSARCVLLELCGQLKWVSGQPEPINNGRLWLSREEWEKAGFSSATVTRCLKELVKVGLIYRSRLGGIGRGCSEYALTFYSLTKDTNGLFFQGFRKNAWSNYVAEPKKSRESNLNRDRFKNDLLPTKTGGKQIKFKQVPVINFKHQESESTNLHSMEHGITECVDDDDQLDNCSVDPPAWLSEFINRLVERGNQFAKHCPVEVY